LSRAEKKSEKKDARKKTGERTGGAGGDSKMPIGRGGTFCKGRAEPGEKGLTWEI